MTPVTTRTMVTGSATADGRPIYMRRDGSWSDSLARGHLITSDEERDQMLQRARASEFLVCDPYAIAVVVEADAAPRAQTLKETIRASGGPTIAY